MQQNEALKAQMQVTGRNHRRTSTLLSSLEVDVDELERKLGGTGELKLIERRTVKLWTWKSYFSTAVDFLDGCTG